MNKSSFIGKHILVLGLANSGEAAAKVLLHLGAIVTVNDLVPYEESEQARKLEKMGAQVICGHHSLHILNAPFSCVIKNPGIPYSNPLIQEAQKRGLPILTEIELASLISKAELVAISGSNGKTTVTSLIYEMLKGGKRRPLLAGNIGIVSC